MAQIYDLNQSVAEGFTGEKKVLFQDSWKDLYAGRQNQSIILQGILTSTDRISSGNNRGKSLCGIVNYGNARGLIPFEESGCETEDQWNNMIGQLVFFVVIYINQESNIFGGSRKQAIEKMATKTWRELKLGQTRTAVVKYVNRRQARLDLGGIPVFLDADEISYGWINDVRDMLTVGDNIDVKIIGLDKNAKQITISLKELYPDPWPSVTKRYHRGQQIMGTVSGIEDFGIFVQLEQGVDVLAKQKTSEVRPSIGDKVLVRVDGINPEKRQIRGYIRRKLPVSR